jgi:hypothetical protein
VDNSFALLSSLNRGLGLTRRSALCIVLCLWPHGAPLISFGAASVLQVWQLMPLIYLLLDLSQIACFMCVSWHRLAEAIQLEAALATGPSSSSSAASAAATTSSRDETYELGAVGTEPGRRSLSLRSAEYRSQEAPSRS